MTTPSPAAWDDRITVISSPFTGLLYESLAWWTDANYAFTHAADVHADWRQVTTARRAAIVAEHGEDWLPRSAGEYVDNMPF
jgi:hypothetical protein